MAKDKSIDKFIHEINVLKEKIVSQQNLKLQLEQVNEELKAANQQLAANEQQLKAANQQLAANEQQLRAANQQLEAYNKQLLENQIIINKNRALLHAVLESPQGMIVFALDNKYRYTAYTSLHKKIIKQIWNVDIEVGMNMLDVIKDPTDRKKAKINFDKALKGEHLILVEKYGDEALKRSFWENRYSPIYNQQNEIIGVSVFVIDISKRKHAEIELKKSQQQYKSAFELFRLLSDGTNDMLWAKDMQGRFIFTNKAICDKLLNAKDVNEPVGKDVMFFVNRERNSHPENKEWFTFGEECGDSDAITIAKKKTCRFKEYGNVYGKYLILDVYKTPLYNENGEMIGTVGSARDITKEKQIEKQLIESEKKYRLIASKTLDTIVTTDINFNITFVNEAVIPLLGYTPYEIINAKKANYITSQSREIINKQIDRLLHIFKSEGKLVQTVNELQFIKKDGKIIDVELSANLFVDDNGKVLGFQGRVVDITERKKFEEELVVAKNKAEESDRLKSAFLANMSHEIRTPMNGILGFTSLLEESNFSNKEKSEFIKKIQLSGQRMLNTINDIIDISKIEAGLMEMSYSETSIKQLLNELLSFFLPETSARGLSLTLSPLPENKELTVLTDNQKLYGILSNIIKNAVKFTRQGSITLGCKIENNMIEFSVKDTGIGIPESRINAVFNRFEQADIGDIRAFQGSGLGLAIAKAYVNMLGGKIQVVSKESVGSEFTFTIPYIPKADTDNQKLLSEKSKSLYTTNLKNKEILLVDDEDTSLLFLNAILKNKFGKIHNATNGKQAVEICMNNPKIDIVLMDLKLPVLNGYEAVRKIRQFDPNLIIIAQTAYALAGDEQKALEAGCTDYIPKPINKNKLLEMITRYLNQ